ncbi:MAG TPA: ribonuclease P protein component [candidate division WWE3 bacterium]|uniref:Ribonuclease P protein component n=1 Tax=candidate division WWE3 bacterium TaxID=2053526 RepID=A0A7C1NN36_UNCKA|nr:ribonuclease P protein component [candidate division WWE3 bacterium]
MLPKKNRLSSDFDFRRVRRFGKGYPTPFFSVFVLHDDKDPKAPPRFGFVASTKISKRAVKRNRIKRILRNEISKLLPDISPGVLVSFWVRPKALEAPPDKLRLKVRETLKKAQILQVS